MDEGIAANNDERQAAQRDEWDAEVLRALLSTPQGRHWVERLLDQCSIYGDAYREDGDIYAACKRDGRASIGRLLLDQLGMYCPDLYNRMMRERRTRIERALAQQKRDNARAAEADEA